MFDSQVPAGTETEIEAKHKKWWDRLNEIAPWAWRSDPYLEGMTEEIHDQLMAIEHWPSEAEKLYAEMTEGATSDNQCANFIFQKLVEARAEIIRLKLECRHLREEMAGLER